MIFFSFCYFFCFTIQRVAAETTAARARMLYFIFVNIFYREIVLAQFLVSLAKNFYEVGAYFGQCYSRDSFNEHYDAAAALAL